MATELKESESEAMVPRGDVDMLMVEAVRSGNIEVMERVMAIRRELKAEAAKEAFFDSLAAFQAECPVIEKTEPVWNKANTYILYHYAPLDKIVKQVGPLIAKHGLSYTIKAGVKQPEKGSDLPLLVAQVRVHHLHGHSEFSEFEVPIQPNDFTNKAQQSGNANSYAKRYAFCNAFGILTEDPDDDAQGGRISPEDARKARQPVSQPRSTPTSQKAAQRANGAQVEGGRIQLEPAGEGEAIDKGIAEGIWKAMEYGALSLGDFKKRFPKLTRLGEIKRGDEHVVTDWIADPASN